MKHGVIGRGAELAAVGRLLDRAATMGAVLTIEGESGIGKTILWNAGLQIAAERDFAVLSARPAESEAGLPLSGFGDLFGSLADVRLRGLPPPQRAAIEVALIIREPIGDPSDERTLAVATTTFLREMTADQPVLIAVDDLQWLDTTTARLLSYAIRRLGDRRLGLIATIRQPLTGPTPLDLGSWGGGDVDRLVLDPLSVAVLHELLLARVGRSFSRSATVRIRAAAGGNPFYALEIGRALVRDDRPVTPGEPLPIPATLAGLTVARIASLPANTQAALLAAAVAVEQPTLAALESSGIEAPAASLGPAVREGIVEISDGDIRFAHPLLASAVLSRADPDGLRDVHRMLARGSRSADARTRHLARASSGPDRDAADAMDAMARRTVRRGAPIEAGEMLELAASLTPADQVDERMDRILRSGECYFAAGETQRATALLEDQIRDLPGGPRRAASLRVLAQIRARSLSVRDAFELATTARAEAGDAPEAIAEIELDLAFYAFCLGDLVGAVGHARAALPYAERAGLDPVRAEALACVSMAEFWLGRGRSEARMEEALALEDPGRVGPLEIRPRFVQALLLLWTGAFDDAMTMLIDLRCDLLERGQETALPFLSLFLVLAAVWQGDLAAADGFATEAQDTAELNAEPMALGLAWSQRALVDAMRGEIDGTRHAATEALTRFQESGWNVYLTWPLWAAGLLESSLGNARRVDELLGPMAEGITSVDGTDPILGIVLPDEIEALVELGEWSRAERYVAWLERGGRALDRPWALALAARSRGILLAAQGDLDGSIAMLQVALDEHRRLDIPFALGRTLLVKGQVHRRRKEKRSASESLAEALRIFEHIGATRWADRARSEAGRLGLRPRAPSDLTATERRVAQLASTGLTNRQVATAAFVSPKTVDNVLGRVYRKLGIHSRARLGAIMAGDLTSQASEEHGEGRGRTTTAHRGR